jgi:hypothetical protein
MRGESMHPVPQFQSHNSPPPPCSPPSHQLTCACDDDLQRLGRPGKGGQPGRQGRRLQEGARGVDVRAGVIPGDDLARWKGGARRVMSGACVDGGGGGEAACAARPSHDDGRDGSVMFIAPAATARPQLPPRPPGHSRCVGDRDCAHPVGGAADSCASRQRPRSLSFSPSTPAGHRPARGRPGAAHGWQARPPTRCAAWRRQVCAAFGA